MNSESRATPKTTDSTAETNVVTIDAVTDIKHRRCLFAAVAFGAIWLTALAVLAWQTANPVTVNQGQILRSTRIVIGTLDEDRGLLIVEEERIDNEAFPPNVVVTNLDQTRLKSGERYIVPLQRDTGKSGSPSKPAWEVTPSQLPTQEPLVYPATEDALNQLERILQDAR
ncbi:hypothetical protein [Thalassoroseus pseudoceratinae]|uniref:hypothetical protein n=1 Tax=Thalassoroseus pseudoceratinae TaxID=2713176 RepID=UPI0014238DFB|nr:hypothetical protein [Thalassoroseus pseudoceratinae]